MKMKTILAGCLSLAVTSLGAVPSAFAVQQVTTSYSMPVQAELTVYEYDCSNAPGPRIAFETSLALGGITVELIFRNYENKDVHTLVEDVEVAGGIAAGTKIVLPKQPVQGGVDGNPFIWVQLVDTNNKPLTSELYLGRCVQGATVSMPFSTPTVATALVSVMDCTNNPGPYIYTEGSLSLYPGIKARFVFRNNDNPVGGPHNADAMVDVSLVSAGYTLKIPKQPVQGGVGGNPWISVAFADGSGQAIGSEYLLGRCVQLLPGN